MKSFEELGICPEIRQAIEELGFENPMPIQEAVAPLLIESGKWKIENYDTEEEGDDNFQFSTFNSQFKSKDLIALAQTGTGKTAAFGLPLLQKIDAKDRTTQVVILSPTRELCLQIADDLRDFSKYLKGINIVAVYGGTSIIDQIRSLRHGAQIIVATPGRLIDLIERGKAHLDDVRHIVLDEADEMLNMGFSESINRIFESLPDDRQTLLFSATMSKEVERIAKSYLHEYDEIVVGSRNEGAEHVNHIYYMVNAKDKYLALKRIVDYYPRIYGIVFCRTKIETQEVADKLIKDGYNADSLHGDLSQQQRDLTMQKFRQHLIQLLVATDVAARGLDVDDLTHVINYAMPDDTESYTHRSGRTGRAGKKGTSIAIIHSRERHKIRDVEKTIGKEFVAGKLPTPQEICTKQLFRAIDEIEKTDVIDEQIEPFMAEIRRHFEYVDKEEILKKVVSREFGRFLSYYADAPEIEEVVVKPKEKGKRNKGGNDGDYTDWSKKKPREGVQKGFVKLFLNLGKNDGFYPGEVMQFVNRNMRGTRQEVGHIDLLPDFCFIEVPASDARKVIKALNGSHYHNKKVSCHEDTKGSGGKGGQSGKGRGQSQRGGGRRGRRDDFDVMPTKGWKQAMFDIMEQEEGWARRRPKKQK